ncbi:MAG: glycoside hydrolase family 55 protein [Verrucomicrobiales bacterium]|nr:glycoside hydrolase family 55 protein [Verrucomicrobiales bacterium]
MISHKIPLTIPFLFFLAIVAPSAAQIHSDLWGEKGEKWTTKSRLPDFSYAGYHCGEIPLPQIEVVSDVTKFGAKGDGKTDCTEAFRAAIAATEQGAIAIPAGRYLISDILWIKKKSIVLRGAGPGKTILHFTKELKVVKPNPGATTSGRPTSNYSWSGGFIWVKGRFEEKSIAAITSESKRGTHQITLESSKEAASLEKGQWVVVEIRDDPQKTLLDHLYAGDAGDTDKITTAVKTRLVSRIASIKGNEITLERPLAFDIRKSWQAQLKNFHPKVSEVGIEDLSIDFPAKPYLGHFTERGMNGIAMNRVAHCWIKNVQISNSDSGITLGGSIFTTIDGLIIDSKRSKHKGTTGHHGVSMAMDSLCQNFDFRTHFIHDIGLNYLNTGNVIKNGKGSNLSLDHHKKAPYANLFCNLDLGVGSEIWRSGGGKHLGKHSGARNTYWNIQAKQNIAWPPAGFAPDQINLIGVQSATKSIKDPNGKWFETILPTKLRPIDLHAAQLKRRLDQQRK